MNIKQEREAFEADQLSRYPGACMARNRSGFVNYYVEMAWQGWLAAKRHALKQPVTPTGQNDPTTYKEYRVTYLDHTGTVAYRRVTAKTPKLAMKQVEGINPLFHALSAKRPTVYVPVHLRVKK